ncbi:locomotion-related protein Hikaru genki [Trichonephila inaurata madagascariensis]|uniref:Locomotion-related protein Hikaru genki n=1 Tax=Trichonephila inaurata madagascariensis TaxID=2747483 RepID=A0A8X6WN00_9ARAC|nr:locomotion-related protein Hikaru genki [Trichonephila inaurata madagascariensis]
MIPIAQKRPIITVTLNTSHGDSKCAVVEKPPTILFRHQLGPIAQSNEGKLIVYPGTILHLECLWIRKYGIPTGRSATLIESTQKAKISGQTVGSRANFSCPSGYGLRGEMVLQCLDTGQWSAPVPYCEEVICESPEVPKNGYLQSSNKDKYRGGDVLQFACDANHMMDGQNIIVCQENGRWSASVPKCKNSSPVSCGIIILS